MKNIDLYQVLGIERDSDEDQIKKAYRELVKKYHPDATGGDEEKKKKFIEIQHAYEILSDPGLRTFYDENGYVNSSVDSIAQESRDMILNWIMMIIGDNRINDSMQFDVVSSLVDLMRRQSMEIERETTEFERKEKRIKNFLKRFKDEEYSEYIKGALSQIIQGKGECKRRLCVMKRVREIITGFEYDNISVDELYNMIENYENGGEHGI
jgi:DnaJ-class molecular chaperone